MHGMDCCDSASRAEQHCKECLWALLRRGGCCYRFHTLKSERGMVSIDAGWTSLVPCERMLLSSVSVMCFAHILWHMPWLANGMGDRTRKQPKSPLIMSTGGSHGAAATTKAWLQVVGALALGQIVSLLVTITGLTSSTLARRGIDAPTSQSFCSYLLLACVYGFLYLCRGKKERLPVDWYYYLLLAFIDVEANYVVVKAYQYTSVTSVMLLDCWSIPCVVILTWFFLKTRYSCMQLVGAGICVAGLALVILSDAHAADRSAGSNPIRGDALVIVGSMLYAVSNVSEEFLVKKVEFTELMAFLGAFGALISACQLLILERHELESIHWTTTAALPFLGFAASMFLFYTLTPLLLKVSGATMLNLSLLTSDMWAVLIRIFAYHQLVDWLYFVAFAAVAAGLVVYSLRNGDNAEETTTSQTRYKPIDDTTQEVLVSTDIVEPVETSKPEIMINP